MASVPLVDKYINVCVYIYVCIHGSSTVKIAWFPAVDTCIYMCVCICIFIYRCIFGSSLLLLTPVYIYMCASVYTYIHVHVYVTAAPRKWPCILLLGLIYSYVCVCIYIYICIYGSSASKTAFSPVVGAEGHSKFIHVFVYIYMYIYMTAAPRRWPHFLLLTSICICVCVYLYLYLCKYVVAAPRK